MQIQINAIWNRWIDNLAAVLITMHEAWRERRALVIAHKDKRFVISDGSARGNVEMATADVGTAGAGDLTAVARQRFVTLELGADEFVLQRIRLPARAREFLEAIVGNQIDRLSPWPKDRALFGFNTEASRKDAELVEARVAITSRGQAEALRRELAALGVTVDRITARDCAPNDTIALWSRSEPNVGKGAARRAVALTLLGIFGVSLCLSAWALASAADLWTSGDDAAERSATLERRLEPGHDGAGAALNPAVRVWNEKATSPPTVLLLDVLSRVLPDAAYLTELSLRKSTLRISGLTSDAPSLLSPLEQSGQFTSVRFFAPTTRGPDGKLFWFHVEAQVVRHFTLPEN
ncbi:MAG TPA: PilN domain-containing protein [Xanthobacteraceae bacterium]